MKKYALIAGLLMIQAPFAHNAEADAAGTAAKFAMQILEKVKPGTMCKKASFFSGNFTARSFDGVACSNPGFAAYVKKKCSGVDDFDTSSCAKKMRIALAGKNAEKLLKEEAKENKTLAKAAKEDGIEVEE